LIPYLVWDLCVSGALLMANLQANLRSQYAIAVDDLPRLLTSVNRLFYESTDDASYATLFFADYDDFLGGWPGEFFLFDDASGDGRNNAVQLVDRLRDPSCGSIFRCIDGADQWYADSHGYFVV